MALFVESVQVGGAGSQTLTVDFLRLFSEKRWRQRRHQCQLIGRTGVDWPEGCIRIGFARLIGGA